MTHRQDPGAEHDAYLRSALRHAPDAALVPSEALNEAILKQARSAAARPSVPASGAGAAASSSGRALPRDWGTRAWRRLASVWMWFGQPAVATGFAGLMVATLVGVMWWDRPLDEALPQRAERPAVADRLAPASASVADRLAAASAPATARPTAPSAADAGADAQAREPERVQQNRAEATPDPRRLSMRDGSAPSKAPARAATGPSARTQGAEAPSRSAATAPNPSALTTAPAPPPPTPAVSPPEQSPQAFPRFADPSVDASTRARDRTVEPNAAGAGPAAKSGLALGAPATPAAAPSSRGALRSRDITANAPTESRTDQRREVQMAESTAPERMALNPLAKSAQVVAATSPLPALRAALAAEPGRWTWIGDDGTVRPSSPELQRWLARLEAATLVSTDDPSPAASAADRQEPSTADRQGPERTVTLLRDGERHTTLRLGVAVEAIPQQSPGRRWQARLSPSAAAALRAGIPAR